MPCRSSFTVTGMSAASGDAHFVGDRAQRRAHGGPLEPGDQRFAVVDHRLHVGVVLEQVAGRDGAPAVGHRLLGDDAVGHPQVGGAAEPAAGQLEHGQRALGDHVLRVAQRGEGLGGPVHEPAQAGQLRRVPHLPLEALAEMVHGHPDHRCHGGPQEEAAEIRRFAALHGDADDRQAHHGGDDDDRRVEARVVERHAEDREEDQGREAAGGALHAGIGATRDQQQGDRDQVADGRDEDGPAGEAPPGQEERKCAGHEDGQAGPVETQVAGPDGRAALAWATAASPMKMDART